MVTFISYTILLNLISISFLLVKVVKLLLYLILMHEEDTEQSESIQPEPTKIYEEFPPKKKKGKRHPRQKKGDYGEY